MRHSRRQTPKALQAARRARFDGASGTWPVRVLRIGAVVQTATRTVEVRLSPVGGSPAPGADGLLR